MSRSTSSNRALPLARGVLLLACGLTLLFGVSGVFIEGVSRDEGVLQATFGAGMGLFGIALSLIALDGGDRRAWLALWYLPVFFAVHVATFGTWIPDAPLLVLTAGALLVSRAPTRAPAAVDATA